MRDHHSKFMLITSFFLYLVLYPVTLLVWIERFNQRLISFLFFLLGLAFLFTTHHLPYKRFILVYICFLVLSMEPPLENKTNIFILFFFNLCISLSTMTNFYKFSYSEHLKSRENRKVKRSTTSIKTKGDLHPHEVSILVLTYSSVNIFGDHTGEWTEIWNLV